MQKLIIFAALTACCLAVPLTVAPDNAKDALLQRPSPINPEVLSDPKPAEKITKITDPKELQKHKRETDTKTPPTSHLTPTVPPVQPNDQAHAEAPSTTVAHSHRQKRDHKSPSPADDKKPALKPNVVAAKTPAVAPTKAVHQKRQAPQTQQKPSIQQKPQPPQTQQKQSPQQKPQPQQTQQKPHTKRDDAAAKSAATVAPIAPLIHRDHDTASSGSVKPQTLPFIMKGTQAVPAHVAGKRDITASTTLKENEKSALVKSTKDATSTTASSGYVKPQTLPAHSHAKRDIPVPLTPKHQHDDHSVEDKNSKENDSAEKQQQNAHKVDEKDAVQIEDLIHQTQHKREEASSASSTTQHPVFRERPVPVAELFNRSKGV